MSVLSYLFKSKKKMGKPKTKVVRIRKYLLTSHAQNRIAEPSRCLKKLDLVDNLYRKPLGISKIKFICGKPSFRRVGRYCTVYINPINYNIASVRRIDNKDKRDFNLLRKKGSRKYVKKSK